MDDDTAYLQARVDNLEGRLEAAENLLRLADRRLADHANRLERLEDITGLQPSARARAQEAHQSAKPQ